MPAEPLARSWRAACGHEGVGTAVGAARDAIDAVRRQVRRPTPQHTSASLLRGALASAQLDGGTGVLDSDSAVEPDAITAGAIRLNTGLPELITVINRSPLQAFARLQLLATDPDTPESERGRPRDDPSISAGLLDLGRTITSTDLPALAIAALAHAEIATLQPFSTANGVVARGLERLLYLSKGIDPQALVAIEEGYLQTRGDYSDALSAYALATSRGRAQWVLYACSAVSRAANLAAAPASSD